MIITGLTLVASVRRRRRDLALLKTLGFTQRQLAGAVAWQASVAAIVGVVGDEGAGGIALVPVAVDSLRPCDLRRPEPSVPSAEVVLIAVGALVLA